MTPITAAKMNCGRFPYFRANAETIGLINSQRRVSLGIATNTHPIHPTTSNWLPLSSDILVKGMSKIVASTNMDGASRGAGTDAKMMALMKMVNSTTSFFHVGQFCSMVRILQTLLSALFNGGSYKRIIRIGGRLWYQNDVLVLTGC